MEQSARYTFNRTLKRNLPDDSFFFAGHYFQRIVHDPENGYGNRHAASRACRSGQMLQSALGQVSGLQDHAGQMATAFAQGKTGDIHSVMIASEQATMALQLTTQIRNKAVDAYQEVMRMSM